MMPAKLPMLALPMTLLLAASGAAAMRDIWSDYAHVPTACEVPNCVAGGCLFENCARPLSCSGGLCFFRYVALWV